MRTLVVMRGDSLVGEGTAGASVPGSAFQNRLSLGERDGRSMEHKRRNAAAAVALRGFRSRRSGWNGGWNVPWNGTGLKAAGCLGFFPIWRLPAFQRSYGLSCQSFSFLLSLAGEHPSAAMLGDELLGFEALEGSMDAGLERLAGCGQPAQMLGPG
jgi:hypothetical protein